MLLSRGPVIDLRTLDWEESERESPTRPGSSLGSRWPGLRLCLDPLALAAAVGLP